MINSQSVQIHLYYINLENTETNELSILIKLPEGDVCKSNAYKRYQITQVISCDE
jgi:hypothetical protein